MADAASVCVRRYMYVIKCTKHAIQYVGEMENAPHLRTNGHGSAIENRCQEKGVAKHLNSISHSIDDLSTYVAEKMHRENSVFRKAKESFWIRFLWSLASGGTDPRSPSCPL